MTADVSGSEAEVTLQSGQRRGWLQVQPIYGQWRRLQMLLKLFKPVFDFALFGNGLVVRSEEHTSALQSLMRTSYAVFCLIKKHNHSTHCHTQRPPRPSASRATGAI